MLEQFYWSVTQRPGIIAFADDYTCTLNAFVRTDVINPWNKRTLKETKLAS